ncbi:MAG: V-type ATP synthase subunit F [Candidatus Caldarchaeum sp.]|nr:V-type ATP synthase subunit F [Candidatus Caldarchaeum sp.]
MRVVAVGGPMFVNGFRLAGAEGMVVKSPDEAFQMIKNLMQQEDVGLVIVSEDISEKFREELNELRAKKPKPLVYELSPPVGQPKKIDYRALLRSVLGV